MPADAVRQHDGPSGRGCRSWGRGRSTSSNAEPDIRAWANAVNLNPARILPEHKTPELAAVLERLQAHTAAGLAKLDELSRST